MDKPVLIMIHGLIGSLVYFDPADRIANTTVHTPDLLGYGKFRDVPAGPLTLQAQVDHVAERLELMGASDVWVLGHSMGGAIAVLLADQRPSLIRALINVEGNFTLKDAFLSRKIVAKRPEEWLDEYQALQSDIPAWVTRCGVSPTPQHVEWCKQLLLHQPAGTVYAMSKAIMTDTQQPDYLDAMHRVVDRGLPIHLIAGERSADAWDVPQFVRDAAVSYEIIPEAGHLMMLEEPDAFCKVVDRVLDR
ncbi:MAG: alpha/beta fold hydrolase [Planctomycetota bacterium]|jgi:pimeloyl-ACP methyl ester carboxylesterase